MGKYHFNEVKQLSQRKLFTKRNHNGKKRNLVFLSMYQDISTSPDNLPRRGKANLNGAIEKLQLGLNIAAR